MTTLRLAQTTVERYLKSVDAKKALGQIRSMSAPVRKKSAARESELRRVLADNIRSLRQVQSLSQEALAAKSGLHRTYVGSVERRERNVSLSTLVILASSLGVTVPHLLTKHPRPDE